MNRFITPPTNIRRNFFRITSVVPVALILLGFSAVRQAPSGALDSLLCDIRQNQILVWQFDYNFDPYNNGQVLRSAPENPRFFLLAVNHTYTLFDHNEKREGRWDYDLEHQGLILTCQKINGKSIEEGGEVLNYKVISYSSEKLILGLQGRHGMTEVVFHPVNTPERGAVSMMVVR
ncbi:MAG: hypothetical protein R3C61_00550 [Bacteroidia bacterium]